MDKKLFRSLVALITYAVLLILFIIRFDEARSWFGALMGVLQPLFIGFAIAFVLNRPTQLFYGLYSKALGKGKSDGAAKGLAVATAYVVLVVLIITFFSIVLPKLVESIQLAIASIGHYAKNVPDWVNWALSKLNLESLDFSKFADIIKSTLTAAMNTLTTALPQVVNFAGNLISIVVTSFLSIIFSIYMLSGKDTLLSQCRRVLQAYAPKKAAAWITDVLHLTGSTFTAFVTGQLIEACILGGLCTVGMLFIMPDYAPLIGVIIGASALIPMVGAFLGGGISAMLLVMVDPIRTVVFLIFLLVLQQLEGNIIYPRVVGSNIGLPAIWVLTAVTVGGGILGFVGILVSVPIASVVYTLLKRDVHKRLGEAE